MTSQEPGPKCDLSPKGQNVLQGLKTPFVEVKFYGLNSITVLWRALTFEFLANRWKRRKRTKAFAY